MVRKPPQKAAKKAANATPAGAPHEPDRRNEDEGEVQGQAVAAGPAGGRKRKVPVPEDWFDGDPSEEELRKKPTFAKKREKDRQKTVVDWPQGAEWLGGGAFGAGTFGTANLYYRVDVAGRIIDIVVVKDCHLSPHDLAKVHHWHGDPKDRKAREHVEIAAMSMYRGREGAQNCIELRHSTKDDDKRWYRRYLDYCSHGDLQDIIRTYRPADHETNDEVKAQKEGQPVIYPPEPFLWSILESVTEACLVLDRESPDAAQRSEEYIVHRGIKPRNVFLDVPRKENGPWPSYPHARLGDFGGAVITSDDDDLNPLAYNGREGTNGRRPPEILPMVDQDTTRPEPVGRLNSKMNVWGIDTLICALMNRQSICNDTDFDEKRPAQPEILQNVEEQYSERLRNLVLECTAYWPEERIELQLLRERIRQYSKEEREGRLRSQEHAAGDVALSLQFKGDSSYVMVSTPARDNRAMCL